MDIYNERAPKNIKSVAADVISENNYEELEYILQTGTDINDGIVYICGEILETTLFDIIVRVRSIQSYRESSKYKGNAKDPITFLINSPGGNMHDMLGIIDFIQGLDIPVNTICRGTAFSAAAVILACGTGTRAMSKRSGVMFHQSLNYAEGKFNDVKASIAYTQVMENDIQNILAEVTKQKDANWWKEKMKTDYFLSAQEALELGVIDVIL
jgi:ATP-dependent Clp protease protease subunit